ncbi:uncharacterized protein LOC127862094 isoform X2 [Dreissena polymorpha]|uniref:uncharacterized protein LOC127862094 isoform X2 n=1 Tax=Dreissena polymorpha TaxID=45954 RepID=UPI0022651290|nr:uncharacterized protein LOC127862094 isoform X2 [Dreissena polymorpha]
MSASQHKCFLRCKTCCNLHSESSTIAIKTSLFTQITANASAAADIGEFPALRELHSVIARLERATRINQELDAVIDAVKLNARVTDADVTQSVQNVSQQLVKYCTAITDTLKTLRTKLSELSDAAITRCKEQSANDHTGQVQQHINFVDDLITNAKKRIETVNTDNNNLPNMVSALKRQIHELEQVKEEVKLSRGLDSARSTTSERLTSLLQNDGGQFILEDILKWREEALRLRRKYESLLDDNAKLENINEESVVSLEDSNRRLLKELAELRTETINADSRAEKAHIRVQKIEEKLLDERLSHEVEVNYLRALLEKKDSTIETLMINSPRSPIADKDAVRPTPEGYEDEAASKSKPDSVNTTDDKKEIKPSPNKINETGKETNDENDVDSFREWIQAFDGNKTQIKPSTDKLKQEEDEEAKIKDTLDKLQVSLDGKNTDDTKPLIKDVNDIGVETEHDQQKTQPVTRKISPVKKKVKAVTVKEPEKTQGGKMQGGNAQAEQRQQSFVDEFTNKNKVHPQQALVSHKIASDVRSEGTKSKRPDSEKVVVVSEGAMKEIIYRRSDGDIDGNLSYHKGVGAVIRTTCGTFGVDSVQCEIVDGLQNDMLPDFVEGERPISFHIHFQQKYGAKFDLQGDETLAVFVPHRPVGEFEEVILVQSVEGGDWEPCDTYQGAPSSLDKSVQVIGTEFRDITDVKLVVIARERTDSIIAGETHVSHVSKFDPTVVVNIRPEAFRVRTEVKLMVHHRHRQEMLSAIEIHGECKRIMSCTAFVSLQCEQVTREDISVVMELQEDTDAECRYTMFSLEDSGWKLADCDWEKEHKKLLVHLRSGTKKYRMVGLELPRDMTVEERLAAVRTLHEHTDHHLARLLFRQRQDTPDQAVVLCLRSRLIKKGIYQLNELGYNIGGYPSSQFCLVNGDRLVLEFSGDVTAQPVNAENMEMTFYSQKEISTRQLRLMADTSGPRADTDMLQGCLNASRYQERDKILLGETIYLPTSGAFDESFIEKYQEASTLRATDSTLSPRTTDQH